MCCQGAFAIQAWLDSLIPPMDARNMQSGPNYISIPSTPVLTWLPNLAYQSGLPSWSTTLITSQPHPNDVSTTSQPYSKAQMGPFRHPAPAPCLTTDIIMIVVGGRWDLRVLAMLSQPCSNAALAHRAVDSRNQNNFCHIMLYANYRSTCHCEA